SREIRVFERDGADDTFGWGIVFSDQTFSYLRDNDEPTFEKIVAACETWDNVDVVHRGQKISIRGNRFSGIARIAFLKILQRRAAALGVELKFHATVTDRSQLGAADLLVGADGEDSLVPPSFGGQFGPEVAPGRKQYI